MRTSVAPGMTNRPLSSSEEVSDSLATELERAKEELELVSYVTSHDLQAPLRNILYACEEMNGHLALTADEAGLDTLQRITNEATRMKTLMQGVLDYLRLETYGPAHSMMESGEIVTTALTLLEEKTRATGAKITHDVLPQVYGHRGRLIRLFVNLLDNAMKFCDQVPVINITTRRAGDVVEFCISDNGIGIDEEYHNIVFGLFQRLHPADAFPGDGIGLALCRKIVESHGGKLWVESASDKGSRFRFTLPATKAGK